MRTVIVIFLLLGTVALANLAAAESGADRAQIREWVAKLDSDSYAARSLATERLILAGGDAIQPVAEALEQGGLETIIRGTYVLRQLALTAESPETQEVAYEALERLSRRRLTTASRRATSAMVAVNDVRKQRAQSYLEQLGAVVEMKHVQVDKRLSHPFRSIHIGKTWRGKTKDLDQLRWITNDRGQGNPTKWMISLEGERINNECLERISRLEHVAVVHLNTTSVDATGISELKDMEDLQFLELLYSPITDDAISDLSSIKNLARIKLYGTQVSRPAADRLRNRMLGVEVDHREGGFLGIACDDNPCRISLVREGTAAARAGLMIGDVITHYNGTPINTMDELTEMISRDGEGSNVNLSVRRGPEEMASTVALGRWESQ